MCGHQFLVGVLLTCSLTVGCGGGGFVAVTGLVTLDGKPLEGASVAFIPEAQGEAAYSTTNAEGVFELATHSQPGAKPGMYQVLVTKLDSSIPKTARPPRSAVPQIYGAKNTTPLQVSLPHTGQIRLELKSSSS